ncbi:MAG: metal-dependent hydrolase, partial [Polyangiaceae bacterium]
MDNLTHAVIGVLLAENALAFAPRSKEPSTRFRAEIYAVSVIGNNLPDLDVVYANHFGPPPFGYLLQHRGFTHTVVAALGFALVMSAVVILLRHRAGLAFVRT